MRRTKPPKIAIRNRQKTLRLNLPVVRRVVREAWLLTNYQSPITNYELSLAFVTDEEIARLNDQFLRRRGPTDVISFQHGELVISTERAMAQARRFRTPLQEELALYCIHGLLHLAGYDDTTPARRRIMARRQRQILLEIRKKLDLQKLFR